MRYIILITSFLFSFFFAQAQTLTKKELSTLNEKMKDYEICGDFSCGKAAVKNKDGLCGYIDKKGELVVPCTLPVKSLFGSTYDYIDYKKNMDCSSEKTFSSKKYQYGSMLVEESPSSIQEKNNSVYRKFSFHNIQAAKSDTVSYFWYSYKKQPDGSFHFCVSKDDSLMGIIDESFNVVAPFVFKKTLFDSLLSMNVIAYQNGVVLEKSTADYNQLKVQVKDMNGKKLLPHMYTSVCVNDHYIFAQRNTFYVKHHGKVDGFVEVYDRDGTRLYEYPFGENFWRNKQGKWWLENAKGERLLSTGFDCFSDLMWNDFCIVNHNIQYSLIRSDGKIIIPELKGIYRNSEILLKCYDPQTVQYAGMEEKSIIDSYKDENEEDAFSRVNSFWSNSEYFQEKEIPQDMNVGDMILNAQYRIVNNLDAYHNYKIANPFYDYGLYYLLDKEGKNLTPRGCDWIGRFSEGLILVRYQGRFYYLNEKGEGLPDEAYE
ncbi:MAG TPA: WG repeat-containing protein [Paludibacteraceae bacterium]|nr:WG repeat-containing protein [Paludibacteraceae bacterium]HQF50752.1 WG repeat-containing protein [Paludibacteraceae bacterium]HQJ90757.1 WG repeat-containing protein [Paludibacteraceae bacterium]